MPGFCLAMFIMSLIFCLFRLPLVIFGAIAWSNLDQMAHDPVIAATVPFEVISGMSLVLLGIPANLALLFKQRWGVWLGLMTVAASLVNVGLAVWQLSIMVQVTPDEQERIGLIIGALMTMAIRLTIIGLYAAAVLKMSKWLASRPVAAA
jgi:hypothetical protein